MSDALPPDERPYGWVVLDRLYYDEQEAKRAAWFASGIAGQSLPITPVSVYGARAARTPAAEASALASDAKMIAAELHRLAGGHLQRSLDGLCADIDRARLAVQGGDAGQTDAVGASHFVGPGSAASRPEPQSVSALRAPIPGAEGSVTLTAARGRIICGVGERLRPRRAISLAKAPSCTSATAASEVWPTASRVQGVARPSRQGMVDEVVENYGDGDEEPASSRACEVRVRAAVKALGSGVGRWPKTTRDEPADIPAYDRRRTSMTAWATYWHRCKPRSHSPDARILFPRRR
jgi:hypothetical protein